jgi:hypothetical protein
MNPSSSNIGVPAGEPKDGDFVAYLAAIEKRQLAMLAAQPAHAAHTPPALSGPHSPHSDSHASAQPGATPLTAAQAEALRARLKSAGDAGLPIGAALMALIGLVFTVQGLLTDGGIVLLLIGLFLLWRAAVAFKRLAGRISRNDLAARLTDTLRAAQSQQRRR